MPHIYSTLSADTEYTDYIPTDSGAREIARTIRIKGGALVAQPLNLIISRKHNARCTRPGARSMSWIPLKKQYRLHVHNGIVNIDESTRGETVEKAIKDMALQDNSAPLTDADYDPKNKKARVQGLAPKAGKVV